MYGAALLVFREVLEAALVVGIVLVASRGVAGSRGWIGAGIAAGTGGALLVAAGASSIAAAFEGVGQEIMNATILLLAVALLTWHCAWMQKHGAQIAREMRDVGHAVAAGTRPLHVLAVVVGLAVLREGSEVVLFLHGILAGGTQPAPLFAGSALGLAAGAAAGLLVCGGLLRIPTRHLFAVTGWLIVLLAAGMAGQAAAYLVQAGVLPALIEPVWDTSEVLPEHGALGQILGVLAGYDDRPSAMQLLWFAAALALIVTLTRAVNRPRPQLRRAAAAPALLLATLALAGHAGEAHAAHVVYSPIVETGEKAIELRGDYDVDDDDALDGGQAHKLDLEWAPYSRWLTEAVFEVEREPGEDLELTELAWENVLQLTDQGRYWADFGLLAEYAHSLEDDGADAVELGLLGQKDFGRSQARLNLLFERDLDSGAEVGMEYRWQYRYRLSERAEPGLEMYGGLGEWGHSGSLDDHEQQIGPALFGKFHAADGALRYEAGVLFGLTNVAPDATVRFLLEYEF
jgi:high-affinity iron transporter